MEQIPEAVRRAYEAEIKRLEKALASASGDEAHRIRESIGDLEAELVVEAWPMDD